MVAHLLVAACAGDEGSNQANAALAETAAPPAPTGELPLRRPGASESPLLPPGAVIGADPDPAAPSLTFSTRAEPREVLGWYRSRERRRDFALESELEEGAEHVLSGRIRATGEMFTLRLSRGVTGGTTATIVTTRG
jgi:hypothetical protein